MINRQIKIRGFAAFLVVALTTLASTANAQQGVNLGAVLQVDSDRIEAAPGVSFAAAVFTALPPRNGLDSPDLIGLFSSATGQYPVIYRGLWLKMTVFPGGFRRLEGVDFDPSGHLGVGERGWEELLPEEGGGFSIALRAERLGAIPLRFRVRHRDGRDRYSLLIFTMSWTRGGSLPIALEIMVQKEPMISGREPEEVFPFVRGFIPARAVASDAGTTQQRVELPGQSVTNTALDRSDSRVATSEPTSPSDVLAPNDQPIEFNSVDLFVWQSPIEHVELAKDNALTARGREVLEKATQGGAVEPQISTIRLDPSLWRSGMIVLDDSAAFQAELLVRRMDRPIRLEVIRFEGRYRAVAHGTIAILRDSVLNITDSRGNLRTLIFTDRPEGR